MAIWTQTLSFVAPAVRVGRVSQCRVAVCRERRLTARRDICNEARVEVEDTGDISAAVSYLNDDAVERNQEIWEYQPYSVPKQPNWKEHIKTLVSSEVFVCIREQMSWTLVIAVTAAILNSLLKGFIVLTTVPHMLCGVAMGLLLVFRTEKAYDRFWEGRSFWSQLIAVSRTLSQLTTTVVKNEAAASNVLRLIEIFPYALKDHLRCVTSIEPAASLLTREEWQIYWTAKRNRPAVIISLLCAAIRDADDGSSNYGERADPLVRELYDILSGCEKIVKTPVPLSYARHTSRFLTVWTMTLPFALVTTFSFLSVPITAVLCWALLSIKTLAEIIERPFEVQPGEAGSPPRSQLPVEDFCKEVEWDIFELRRARRKAAEGRSMLPSVI